MPGGVHPLHHLHHGRHPHQVSGGEVGPHQGLPGEDGHLDPQQELLHLLQVLVQKQGWEELRALALQPAALLVDDLQAKPAGGL